MLILFAVMNAGALVYLMDSDALRSPLMVGLRAALMGLAGIGFVLLRKWAVLVYFGTVLLNWVAYFVVYGGEGSMVPLWMTVPVPLAIAVLSFMAWEKLTWRAPQ